MITICTTDTCPKCKILKKKLEDKNISYKEINDTHELLQLGIEEVPILCVDNEQMDFGEAITWVNNQ